MKEWHVLTNLDTVHPLLRVGVEKSKMTKLFSAAKVMESF